MKSMPALALSLLPAFAQANEIGTDAFGVYRTGPATHDRVDWRDVGDLAEPVEHVLIFAGPKSLVAGQDREHLVALSLDRHGNLGGDRATFVFGAGGAAETRTRDGLSDHLFDAGTRADTFVAGATVDGRQSQRASYRVTADIAGSRPRIAPIGTLVPEVAEALELEGLEDQYGNPLPNGTALSILLGSDAGQNAQMAAVTVEATARAHILPRDMTGPFEASVILGGAASEPEPLRVSPMVPEARPRVAALALADPSTIEIVLGPFQTAEGYLLPDGAPVRIVVSGQETTYSDSGWILDGRSRFVLPLPQAALPLDIRVTTPLGEVTRTIEAVSDAQSLAGIE